MSTHYIFGGKISIVLGCTMGFINFQKAEWWPWWQRLLYVCHILIQSLSRYMTRLHILKWVTWQSLVNKLQWKWLCLSPDMISKKIFYNIFPLSLSRLQRIQGRTWHRRDGGGTGMLNVCRAQPLAIFLGL